MKKTKRRKAPVTKAPDAGELNVYRAAKLNGVSHQRLLRAIAAGYLQARRVTVNRTVVYVDPADVVAYLKNPPNRGPKPVTT